MEITVPFLKAPVGAGDLVKAATSAIGVPPCKPCDERAKRMNGALSFTPRQASWASMEYPNIPPGWELTRTAIPASRPDVTVNFYENRAALDAGIEKSSANLYYIWQVVNGHYTGGSAFCCTTVRPTAEKRWSELCR